MLSKALALIVVFLCAAGYSLIPAGAQVPAASVTQGARTYKVKFGRKEVGWERVRVSNQGKNYSADSTSELDIDGVHYTITTFAEIDDGNPVHYSIEVKDGHNDNKYTIDFKDGRALAKIQSGPRSGERKVVVNKNLSLLDRNVWYQYQFLIAKYDLEQGGVQGFNVFIAHPALRQYSARVEFQEQKDYRINGQKIQANVFGVELGGAFQLIVTADENGVPLEIEIPAQKEKITLESR